ncbi:MAG: hypothetical protein WBD26_12860, partial [Candidatus Acidiferrales bacterium]
MKIREKAMRCGFVLLMISLALTFTSFTATAQDSSDQAMAAPGQQAPAPRSKDGKKLFGTREALEVARVSSPRISPDGSTVAYLVSSVKMEKDDPG